MSDVYFIDTSILTNILEIPGKCQDTTQVKIQFREYVKAGVTLILPLATIIETGNHIAHIPNGDTRREKAAMLSEYLRRTVANQAPWVYNHDEITDSELASIAAAFPDKAMQGIGIGDLSILEAYKKYCHQNGEHVHVHIWTLDHHLIAMQQYE